MALIFKIPAVQRRPVRLGAPTISLLGPGLAIEPGLQLAVRQIERQRPCQARAIISRSVDRAAPVHRATSETLIPASRVSLNISRTRRMAILSVGIGPSKGKEP